MVNAKSTVMIFLAITFNHGPFGQVFDLLQRYFIKIENHSSFRKELQLQGVEFVSDTDTEVIPHLIARELNLLKSDSQRASGGLLLEAVRRV